MFKRFSNSLLSPKDVAKYSKDSIWYAILLFFILLIMIMIPTFIGISNITFLNHTVENEIKQVFINESIPYEFDDYVLKAKEGNEADFKKIDLGGNFVVIFTTDISKIKVKSDEISLVFAQDGIYAKYYLYEEVLAHYTNYPYLQSLDLSTPGLFNSVDFWDQIFYIVEEVFNTYKPIFIAVVIIMNTFDWLIYLGFFVLLMSVFCRFRTMGLVKFGTIFKMSIYNVTPVVICMIISELFGFALFSYLGYVIGAIYNIITINQVIKEYYDNRNEGVNNGL